MAEFCLECSIDVWGHDEGDFAGLSTPEDTANEMGCVVLCETCGFIIVDHTGKRVTYLEQVDTGLIQKEDQP